MKRSKPDAATGRGGKVRVATFVSFNESTRRLVQLRMVIAIVVPEPDVPENVGLLDGVYESGGETALTRRVSNWCAVAR
jgi:hypothetical protein